MMMIPNMFVVVATHVAVDGFFVLDGNSPIEYLLDYYSMQNFIIMEDNQSSFIKNMSAQLSTISSRYLFLLTNIFYSTAHKSRCIIQYVMILGLRTINRFSQSRRRSLLGPSPG